MKNKREVIKYARAVFNVAEKSGELSKVSRRLELLLSINGSSPEFRLFLQSRRIKPKDKIRIIKIVFVDFLSSLEIDLISYLIEDGNVDLLDAVIKRFGFIRDNVKTRLNVTVSTSEKMSSDELEKLINNIEQKLDKKINVDVMVESNMLGGIKFRIGNKIVDGSVATRLEKLQSSLYQG